MDLFSKPSDVVAALAGTRWGPLQAFRDTTSTNSVAAAAARAGAPEGLVVVADHQTAGRGRFDRRWEAAPGTALLMSVVLRPGDLPARRRHLAVAAVSLAAAEAAAATGSPLSLKWPNDLLAGDRKVAGVLAEAVADAVVVGMGLNVSAAPPEGAFLEAVSGRSVDRWDLLVDLLRRLDGLLGAWDDVAERYRTSCATVGARVRVSRPQGELVGMAVEVNRDGQLVVATSDGPVTVTAGDVTHLRSHDV